MVTNCDKHYEESEVETGNSAEGQGKKVSN